MSSCARLKNLPHAFALLASLQVVLSYPESWFGCSNPDMDRLGTHGYQKQSGEIEFQLLIGEDLMARDVADKYNPGQKYVLKVTPNTRSEGLLTASFGKFTAIGGSNSWEVSCDGLRVDFGSRRSVFYVLWTAPEDDDPRSRHDVEFKVTFSSSYVGDFVWQHATIASNTPERKFEDNNDEDGNGLQKFGSCSMQDGSNVCEAVCAEVKVDQLPGGKLKMRCIMTS